MLKRVLNISLWVLSVSAVIFLLAFTNVEQADMQYDTAINVNIKRSINENRFLDGAQILNGLQDKQIKLRGTEHDVNLAQIEDELKNNPYIKSAEVYATINGKLTMDIVERTPILRVITAAGNSYYVDEDGTLMPLSSRFTAHVPVASGMILEEYSTFYNIGVAGIEKSEKLKKTAILDDLYRMVKYIKQDSLWSAQIEQLYVLPTNEIQLVPKIGNGTIAFGEPTDMEEKFDKLRAFYKHAIAQGTFNGYQTINLKYKNQVVCTKKQ